VRVGRHRKGVVVGIEERKPRKGGGGRGEGGRWKREEWAKEKASKRREEDERKGFLYTWQPCS
jgi:hypothetical protein